MVVDKKYRMRGENGKMTKMSGPQSGPLKNIPSTESFSPLVLKSEDHMILPYAPFMKHIHPRAGSHEVQFMIDGSFVTYYPSASEFLPDLAESVQNDTEIRHKLFFKRDDLVDDKVSSNTSLWFCISVQSSKNEPLLRCEQVGTGITEDIPIGDLVYAKRVNDEKSIAPYGMWQDSSSSTNFSIDQLPSQSGPGIKKMQNKKHGKADATLDQEHIHVPSSWNRV